MSGSAKRPSTDRSPDKYSNNWQSSFFDQVYEPQRHRIHEWVNFDIKNLGNESDLENLNIHPVWHHNNLKDHSKSPKGRTRNNVRKHSEPFWMKNDGEWDRIAQQSKTNHQNKVIEYWPLREEDQSDHCSNNSRSKSSNDQNHHHQCFARTLSKLSYDSTGPHDERYYVQPSEGENSMCNENQKHRRKRSEKSPKKELFAAKSSEPMSLPVGLGTKLSSRSSPSLVMTKATDMETNFPEPDYSPQQTRKSKNYVKNPNKTILHKQGEGVWANAARYKGSLENVLQEQSSSHQNRIPVKEIVNRIQKLSELDEKRRTEREQASRLDDRKMLKPNCKSDDDAKMILYPVRVSEYEQFRKTSKSRTKSGIENPGLQLPPCPSQPLPKVPTEYEQFRRQTPKKVTNQQVPQRVGQNSRNSHQQMDENFSHLNTKNLVRREPKEANSISKENKTDQFVAKSTREYADYRGYQPPKTSKKQLLGLRSRLDESGEENSRMSSARSSVESRPLVQDNEPEDTYSVILDDLPPLPPPPPPFVSLPANGGNFLHKNDSYFHRRHGSDYMDPWIRGHYGPESDMSSLQERHSLLRSSPTPPPPPGFEEVQAKQSHFFNSLFPSRANRFGFPVYPERQFGIPTSRGPPVSFAGFSPDMSNYSHEYSNYPNEENSISLVSETPIRKNRKKNLIDYFRDWIES